jgi:hypothetical protein
MNCIRITYVRSVCGNGQLVTVIAFVLGLPAGKDYSASRSVTTPVVPCVLNITANPTEYGRFEYGGYQ